MAVEAGARPSGGQDGAMNGREPLPLRFATPPSWAAAVKTDLPALLHDHAHLERKAASNALDLLGRWPRPIDLVSGCAVDDRSASRWVHVLTSIAQDELRHLGQVLRLLESQGGHFTRHHQCPYARALRDRVRVGKGPRELVDRLLVAALIELRSCERFELLAAHDPDSSLSRFYGSLYRSERGHFQAFLELARSIPELGPSADRRWEFWLDVEAEVAERMEPGPWIHSGCAAVSPAQTGPPQV